MNVSQETKKEIMLNDSQASIPNKETFDEISSSPKSTYTGSSNIYDIDASISSIRLVWFSALSVLILLIWAGFADVDQMVRGMGQVVPSQRVQRMQNLEGGIVQEILVREGQVVEKDMIILRIDNKTADSQYREALSRSLDLAANIARLEALIDGGQAAYPPEVLEKKELVISQNELLQSARIRDESELQVLLLQSETRLREAEEQKELKKQTEASVNIAQKQRELALPALKSKAYSQAQFLDLEQKLQDLKTQMAGYEHSIPRLEVAAQEATERYNLRKAELEHEYYKELSEMRKQYTSIVELLSAGDDKVQRTEMRSPVRGVIKTILANTIGGVVAPGATVMEIVPLDDSLIIEAKFSPADIAFLRPGLRAKVRVTAYDFSVYGGMDATVENISADTIENQKGETFYNVKVRTDKSYLQHGEQDLPIMAGMVTEVDVLTGKQTILDYLLKPLLKTQQRAFREK